jgi:hypothetical protein
MKLYLLASEEDQAGLEWVVPHLQPPPSSAWRDAVKTTIPPAISGLVLLFATYFISGAFSNAIQQQQTLVAAVKEMQPLLKTLSDAKITREDATAAALSLSAFGPSAINPLINILQQNGETQVPAALDGLRAIGLASSKEACTQFDTVLKNRTRLFTWQTQRYIIIVAGEVGCVDLEPTFKDLSSLIGRSLNQAAFRPYSETVQDPGLNLANLEKVQAALTDTMKLLRQQNTLRSCIEPRQSKQPTLSSALSSALAQI